MGFESGTQQAAIFLPVSHRTWPGDLIAYFHTFGDVISEETPLVKIQNGKGNESCSSGAICLFIVFFFLVYGLLGFLFVGVLELCPFLESKVFRFGSLAIR